MKGVIAACAAAAAAAGFLVTHLAHDVSADATNASATVYVANANGQSVSALTGDTLQAAHADIPTPQGPSAVAVAPDGLRAYATNGIFLTVIDAATNEHITNLGIGGDSNLVDLVVSPDSSKVYACQNNFGAALVVDVATLALTDTYRLEFPDGSGTRLGMAIDISPDGTELFVLGSSQFDSTIMVVKMSAATGEELDYAEVEPSMRELKVSADGQTLIVVGDSGPTFRSTSNLEPVVGPAPDDLGTGLDLAVSGTRVYVLNASYQLPPQPAAKPGPKAAPQTGAPSVDVYEVATGTYVESLDLGFGAGVQGIAVPADGGCAYFTRWDSENVGSISVLNLTTGVVGPTASTGSFPRRVALKPAIEIVDSFFLPKKVAYKKNAKTPAKSVFKASGFFDTGSKVVDLTAAATLSVGGFDFQVPSLTASPDGRKFSYQQGGLKFLVVKNPFGSSRAKFRLTYTGDLGATVPTDGTVELRFSNDAVDGLCEVLLQSGGFRLGKKRGALSKPNVFVVRSHAFVNGGSKDSLAIIVGLATGGVTPDTASEVRVQYGSLLSATIPSNAFNRDGDSYVFKGDIGGITNVIVDYLREQVTIVGKNLDLGTFPAGQSPLTIIVGVGADDRGVAVRVARKANLLKY